MGKVKGTFIRKVKYHLIKMFRIKDSAEKIARGFAWGTFLAIWPSYPFNSLLAFLGAPLFGGNSIVALMATWIVAPLFVTPFYYYASYLTGKHILKWFSVNVEYLTFTQINNFLINFKNEPLLKLKHYAEPGNILKLWGKIDGFFWAMELGGAILGIIGALAAYHSIESIKKWAQKRKKNR